MKNLVQFLLAAAALVTALLGLLLVCEEKTKDETYVTLYDDTHPGTGE